MITHWFSLDEFLAAHDMFAEPARGGALKVVVS